MANDLTGDFDVVAQFAIPAANRVLAAMHRIERFPHSAALRVDDTDRPGTRGIPGSVVEVIDSFGDTITDHRLIGNPGAMAGILDSFDGADVARDRIVNLGAGLLELPPIVPSDIQGFAQLQLFPPTVDVTDDSGSNVTVKIGLLARYIPDESSSPLAEFIRGEVRVTVPVAQVASQHTNMVKIDIKSANVGVSFIPQWSSRPLTAEDVAAIDLLISNSLKTSFVPSDSELPEDVRYAQFKSMNGARDAIAVLLDLKGPDPDEPDEGPGSRDSAHNIFLGGNDDFALGVGSEFVQRAFQPTIGSIRTTPIPSRFSYDFRITDAFVSLTNGAVVLTIKGTARTPVFLLPNFTFTVTQPISFQANGDSADLVLGAFSLDTTSWIADRIRYFIRDSIRDARDEALEREGTRAKVREMLSARGHLGGFLNSMLKPPSPTTLPPQEFLLSYTAAEIRTAGIVLRGSLAAPDWPVPHAEFEVITSSGATGPGHVIGVTDVNRGPTYSALKTWIPGGTVQRYEWKSQGQTQPGAMEANKFVFEKPAPGFSSEPAVVSSTPTVAPPTDVASPVRGYVPLCLTVHGTRLSSSGPVIAQPVSATVCGVNTFPLFNAAFNGVLPLIALAKRGAGETVSVAGHTEALRALRGRATPNLIVHFGDRSSSAHLEALVDALSQSGRADATTAIVAVLSPADLAGARYADGVTYAEDDGLWERRFDSEITNRPVTLLVAPNGRVLSKHEGEIDPAALARALKTSLVAGGHVAPTMTPPAVRMGKRPPNFIFEPVPGSDMTLRKTAGRPVTLIFWRASSDKSIEAVRNSERTASNGSGHLVLAINDGDPVETAKRVAAENRFSATLVTDPSRKISVAYGVDIWPTIISVDALGVARTIRQGIGGDSDEQETAEQTFQGSKAP